MGRAGAVMGSRQAAKAAGFLDVGAGGCKFKNDSALLEGLELWE